MIDAGLAERQFGIVRDLSLRNPDLAECLKALWTSEPLSPDRDALRAFALTALGVRPEHYEAWYRRAWWGMYAGILIRQRMFKGRGDEVLRLVEPEPGFQAVRSALSGGRGAILLSAHLGLGYVPPEALKHAGFAVKAIARSKTRSRSSHTEEYIFVRTPEERKTSLIRSLRHLRQGGVLMVAPTGQEGEAGTSTPFLGHPLRIFPGAAEIARISGAPLVWASATWTDLARIRLIFEPLPATAEAAGQGWTDVFCAQYLSRLARQMRGRPADLGFVGGFWDELPWRSDNQGGPASAR